MGQKLNRVINWGASEELFGLTFSPLTMDKYEFWLTHCGALTVRMSALPARYAVRTYIDALFMMAVEKQDLKYLEFKMLMGLALGIPEENALSAIGEQATNTGLKCLTVRWGEHLTALLPHQVDMVRKILAKQNGVPLPDESENVEIVKAEEELKSLNGNMNLDLDLNAEIDSVAAIAGLRKEEIRNMSILEFNGLKRAHTRRLNYIICALAESFGSKFKGGNPAPTWMFDRIDPSHGLVSLKTWDKQMDGVIKSGAPEGMQGFMPH